MLTPSFLATLAVLLVAPATAARAQTLPCRPASTHDTILVKVLIGTGTNERSAPIRTALGMQPVDSNSIEIVRDSLVCTQVTRAIDTRAGHPARGLAYLVAAFGPHYVAYEPNMTGGSQRILFVVDSTFTFLRALVMP